MQLRERSVKNSGCHIAGALVAHEYRCIGAPGGELSPDIVMIAAIG